MPGLSRHEGDSAELVARLAARLSARLRRIRRHQQSFLDPVPSELGLSVLVLLCPGHGGPTW